LFAGIADESKSSGAVRCILFTTPTNTKFYDYPAHDDQGIEKLRITYDDKYLITAGKDGCVLLFEIKVINFKQIDDSHLIYQFVFLGG